MLREYPNISIHLSDLMKVHDINDLNLSLQTEIPLMSIKKILNGKSIYLSFRNVHVLSKKFGMQIFEFIDYISQ